MPPVYVREYWKALKCNETLEIVGYLPAAPSDRDLGCTWNWVSLIKGPYLFTIPQPQPSETVVTSSRAFQNWTVIIILTSNRLGDSSLTTTLRPILLKCDMACFTIPAILSGFVSLWFPATILYTRFVVGLCYATPVWRGYEPLARVIETT